MHVHEKQIGPSGLKTNVNALKLADFFANHFHVAVEALWWRKQLLGVGCGKGFGGGPHTGKTNFSFKNGEQLLVRKSTIGRRIMTIHKIFWGS